MNMESPINTLRQKLGEIIDINSAVSLLSWDQECYMPPKAAPGRGQQQATLSGLAHRLFTSPEIGDLLNGLADKVDQLGADDAKLVEVVKYDYNRATKLPERFVQKFALERSHAHEAWVKARKESDFSLFQSNLETMVDLLRQKADLLGYEGSPYNALLENYERGMTADGLKAVFEPLAKEQSALIEKIVNSPNQPDCAWMKQEWAEQAQWDFSVQVLSDLGYDLEAGRQDKSVHPFTTNFDLYDVRITTRIDTGDIFSGLSSTIHECGHALYEQGFCEEDRRSPLAEAISLGIHESQSRMWENNIGRSLPFWKHYRDKLAAHYGSQLDGVSVEQLYQGANQVQPSLIRVESDECTYNLHIIFRFEIETALIEGTAKVSEVPEMWNAKVKDYLGLDVPNDALGCLQDIHWSHGYMGYFPTYALGNLYAAQMFEVILRDIPDLWQQVEAGQFAALLEWLRAKVHRVGRRMTAPELIRSITGNEPSSKPFMDYLNAKYKGLYGV